jgi:hypothetical protein
MKSKRRAENPDWISYPTEKDAPGSNMQVHEVVNNSGLEISLNVVDDDLTAHVDQFDVGQILLRNGLVHLLVVHNPRFEVLDGLLWIHVLVVR